MRTTRRLLFLTMGLVALTLCANSGTQGQQTSSDSPHNAVGAQLHDPEDASLADRGKRQEDGTPSVEGRNRSRRPGTNRRGALPNASPKRISNARHGSPPGNAIGHRWPSSSKRGDVAKSALNHGERLHSPRHVHRDELTRSAVPSRDNMRHRGANAATIGGPAKTSGKNAGGINGTNIRCKP
jgi:hypothetical protein